MIYISLKVILFGGFGEGKVKLRKDKKLSKFLLNDIEKINELGSLLTRNLFERKILSEARMHDILKNLN